MERNEISRKVDMGTSDIGRRESRRQMETYNGGGSAAGLAWKIVGGTALAVAVAALVISLPDIKRYIKISTM